MDTSKNNSSPQQWADNETKAIRTCLVSERHGLATQKQVVKLAIVMKSGLYSDKNRVAVLAHVIGRHSLITSKHLTKHEARWLIDYLEGDDRELTLAARSLLEIVEAQVI